MHESFAHLITQQDCWLDRDSAAVSVKIFQVINFTWKNHLQVVCFLLLVELKICLFFFSYPFCKIWFIFKQRFRLHSESPVCCLFRLLKLCALCALGMEKLCDLICNLLEEHLNGNVGTWIQRIKRYKSSEMKVLIFLIWFSNRLWLVRFVYYLIPRTNIAKYSFDSHIIYGSVYWQILNWFTKFINLWFREFVWICMNLYDCKQ